ncbi:MAG: YfdX family protein [Alphaproteobacteria bacterium]|nr:YfdX family protein [Alphaproteobacteria bacterium]
MKHHTLFMCALVSGAMAAQPAMAQTATTQTPPSAPQAAAAGGTADVTQDPRMAAQRFIEYVNTARVALAVNDGAAAKDNLARARATLAIANAAAPAQPAEQWQAGRLSYNYAPAARYHYFPLATGPVKMEVMKNGPFWARKGLAVTDAEIVYVSLDLSGARVQKRLDKADADIAAGKLENARSELADLSDEVIKVDDRVKLPLEKATDNIALARVFVATGNYDGARYPLRHAESALKEMEKDDQYKSHRDAIAAMRKEAEQLQQAITRNDPTLLDKTDAKLQQWWNDLKSWTRNAKRS